MVRLKIKLVFDFIVLKRGGQLLRDNYNLNTAASIVKFTFSIYHLARVCFLFFISCQKRGRAIGVGLQEENSLWFDWQQSSAILLTACVVCVCVCVSVSTYQCVCCCAPRCWRETRSSSYRLHFLKIYMSWSPILLSLHRRSF